MKPLKPKPVKPPKPVTPMLRFCIATRRVRLIEGAGGLLTFKSGIMAGRAVNKGERVALIEIREVPRG